MYPFTIRPGVDSPGVPASKRKKRIDSTSFQITWILNFRFYYYKKIVNWSSVFENLTFDHISFNTFGSPCKWMIFNPLAERTSENWRKILRRKRKKLFIKFEEKNDERISYSSGIFFREKVTCADIDISSSTWFLLWTALKFSQAEADNGTTRGMYVLSVRFLCPEYFDKAADTLVDCWCRLYSPTTRYNTGTGST